MKNNWPIKTLDSLIDEGVVELTRGKVISKKDLAAFPGDYPVYSSAKDNEGMFGKYGKYMFDEELITWSVDGGGRLFHRRKHKYSVTNVGGILRILKKDALDYRYLFYALTYLHSLVVFDWVKKAHPSVIRKIYNHIPLPPLSEQKKIAKRLDEVFEKSAKALENTEKNIQHSQELFESYLESVFINPDEGWQQKRLKEIGQTQTGLTPSTSNKRYFGNTVPFIKPADVDINGNGSIRYDNEGLSDAGLQAGRQIKKHSILMVCIGASIGKVGFSEKDVSCNQQINALTPARDFNPKYFYYAMRTKSFFNKVLKNSSQATLPIINKSKWENLPISFPVSQREQESLVKKLDTLAEDTKKLEGNYKNKLSDLGKFKKSILKMAFSNAL